MLANNEEANLLLLSSVSMLLIGRAFFEFSLIDSLTIMLIECSTFYTVCN